VNSRRFKRARLDEWSMDNAPVEHGLPAAPEPRVAAADCRGADFTKDRLFHFTVPRGDHSVRVAAFVLRAYKRLTRFAC